LALKLINFQKFNTHKKDIICLSVGDASLKIINQKYNEKFAKSFNNNIKCEVTQVLFLFKKKII
jgi:hypothetical protein